MKEQLISFETAKLAKEKGYKGNPPYFGFVDKFYEKNGTVRSYGMHRVKNIEELAYAPTQSLFQKWLREVHKIVTESCWLPNTKQFCPLVSIMSKTPKNFLNSDIKKYSEQRDWEFKKRKNTYEEALEIALQEALKLI